MSDLRSSQIRNRKLQKPAKALRRLFSVQGVVVDHGNPAVRYFLFDALDRLVGDEIAMMQAHEIGLEVASKP